MSEMWSALGVVMLAGVVSMSCVMLRPAPEVLPTFDVASGPGIGLGVYRPEFPNDLRGIREYESRSEHPLAILHWFVYWGGWKSAFSQSDLELVRAHGAVPMVTWQPWAGRDRDPEWSLRNAVLSGVNDGYIASWAEGLAAYGRPVLLRFAHEMHHRPYPWAAGVNGNTADDYVAAWRYVHAFFERAGATNVLWGWNPNTLGDARASAYSPWYDALYPGDDYVDWLGLDIYNTGPNVDWGAPYWRSFGDILQAPYDAITAVSSRPLILAEVGSAETGGSKAAWVQDALSAGTLVRFPRVRALVWFDTVKEARWALRSSQDSLEAWIAAARAPHFHARPP